MYNFKDNILKLSRTQDLNELKNEWVIVNEQADYSFDKLQCVCNKNIRNYYIFFNKITYRAIYTGLSCKRMLVSYVGKRKFNIKKYFDGIHDYTIIADIFKYSSEIIGLFFHELKKGNITYILSYKNMLIALKNDENLFEYEKTIKGLLYLIEEYEEKQINKGILYKWNVEVQNILDYDEMISKEYDNIFHKNKKHEEQKKNIRCKKKKRRILSKIQK